jgi:hypothetical protein
VVPFWNARQFILSGSLNTGLRMWLILGFILSLLFRRQGAACDLARWYFLRIALEFHGTKERTMRRMHRFLSAATLALTLLVQPAVSQTHSTPQQGTSTGSSTAQTKGQRAQPNCTNNGTYTNSQGQTVPRPENCSGPPKGATAQCRDGSYSFSQSRSGTCSHHGGVAKWL